MRPIHSIATAAFASLGLLGAVVGCGDSGAGGSGGSGSGTTSSTTTTSTTSTNSGSSTSTGSGMCSGATPVALTVKNYLSWCSVQIGSNPAFTGAQQTVCVPAGTTTLVATALTGFELGMTPWHDTDGDTGGGEQGTLMGSGQSQTSTAMITVSGNADCAWVCCETAGTMDCPATDQCP